MGKLIKNNMEEENKPGTELTPEQEKETLEKERNELLEKLKDETQSKHSLVSEIKELRDKKGLSENEVLELKEKLEKKAYPHTISLFMFEDEINTNRVSYSGEKVG